MENYVDKDNSGAGHHQTDTYNIDPALQDYIPPAAIKTTVPTPAGHGLVQQQTTSDEANPQAYRHGSLAYRPAGAQGSGLHANAYMGASTQFPMAGTFPAPAQQYHGLDAGAAPFIALHQYHGFNTALAPSLVPDPARGARGAVRRNQPKPPSWTDEELATLRKGYAQGDTTRQVTDRLPRKSIQAVRALRLVI